MVWGLWVSYVYYVVGSLYLFFVCFFKDLFIGLYVNVVDMYVYRFVFVFWDVIWCRLLCWVIFLKMYDVLYSMRRVVELFGFLRVEGNMKLSLFGDFWDFVECISEV